MGAILAITRPYSTLPYTNTGPSAGGPSSSGPRSPTGPGRQKKEGGGAAAADGGSKGGVAGAAAGGAAGGGGGMGESLFETLLVSDPEVAQVVVGSAVDGLCWPDSESVAKAINACRCGLAYLMCLGLCLLCLGRLEGRRLAFCK